MGEFKYEGFTRTGDKVQGTIEAKNIQDAKRLLRRQGVKARKVQKPGLLEIDLGLIISEKLGSSGFNELDVCRFTKQFSTLIDAGVPILQGLEILYKQEKNSMLRASLMRISQAVSDGKTLFEALTVERGFSKLYCQLVNAGETAGILDEILEKLGEFLDKKIALRNKIKSAMTYPTIVVIVGIAVVCGLMAFVVPQFVDMIKDSGQELPWITAVVMSISAFFETYIFEIFIGLVLSAGGLIYFKKTPQGKSLIDKYILKVPIFGNIVIKGNLSTFSQTLSTMLSSGIPIINALEICADTLDNEFIARDLKKVRAAVERGKTMTEPLKRIPYFPPLIAQMIYVGESTGSLDDMFKKISNVFEVEVEGSIAGMTQLIEPIILVGLGGMIGAVLIAMYLPIFMSAG
jgi:type IV pilus assembly protein PilC